MLERYREARDYNDISVWYLFEDEDASIRPLADWAK